MLRRARSYAEFAMCNMGRVPPTLLAETDEGLIVYLPETMGDETAKDNFANTAGLVSVAYNASAAVLILESWISVARHGKTLDQSAPALGVARP